MTEPIFWLGLSILLVAVSLTAILVAALPAFQELARAARSAEKLFDTLRRELPPTLEAIRLTGLEISDLTDEVTEGVQSAGNVAKQVDRSVAGAKQQAEAASITTRSVFTGIKAAWKTFRRPAVEPGLGKQTSRRSDRLAPSRRVTVVAQPPIETPGEVFSPERTSEPARLKLDSRTGEDINSN